WKETKVQPSKFGNGLFLASTQAVNGDLIAEYTGEIIHDRTAARRHLIYSRTKRNYLFNVNRDGVQHDIDAGKAGNETRFINHPLPPDKPNCNAKCMQLRFFPHYVEFLTTNPLGKYVGGELRLGIYASKHIYYGYELFLDYGKGFFMDEDNEPGSSNNARSPTPQYEDEVMYEYNTRDDSNDEDWDEEVEYGPSSADSTASPEL
ncbi:Histone-lysine N-methyltransferase ezh1, partial [Ceratobasidium sp. 428]